MSSQVSINFDTEDDTPKRKKRQPVTVESVVAELDALTLFVDTELDKRRKSLGKDKGINAFRSIRKRVEGVKKHVSKLPKRAIVVNRNGGLIMPFNITPELADFIQVDHTTKISRNHVQCALSAYININPEESRQKILRWKHLNSSHRDLRDPSCKRIIMPDDKLSKLLDYEKYKKDVKQGLIHIKSKKLGQKVVVTDDKLEYYVIIRLIQHHFLKSNPSL